MSKIKCLKWKYGLSGHNYRTSTLSKFYLTVSLKSIGQI